MHFLYCRGEREMGKLAMLPMLICLLVAMPIAHGKLEESKEIDEWFEKTRFAKQKVSKLHFYFHDILSGKNPTAMRVAQSPITDKSPSFFGLINMFDDPLTVGPKPTSKRIGKAQGLYGAASQTDLALLMVMNFAFTHGKYNGSTLAILARNAGMLEPLREMPIVGGTGMFRLAHGFALAKTHWFNITSGDAVAEYKLYVLHY